MPICSCFIMFQFFKRSFSSQHIVKYRSIAKRIDKMAASLKSLSDVELSDQTKEFKKRLYAGETLDQLMEEAFAVVKEGTYRVLGLMMFEVQLIGGIILHEGKIAEMKTGEGKTLVSVLPTYLNALSGKGVHVVIKYFSVGASEGPEIIRGVLASSIRIESTSSIIPKNSGL